jgi:hypothetical protein
MSLRFPPANTPPLLVGEVECRVIGTSSDSNDDDDDDDTIGLYAGSEENSMGLKADAGTHFKIAGDAGGCNDGSDASEDSRIRIKEDAGGGDGGYGESGTSGPNSLDLDLSGRDACGDSNDVSKVEGGAGDHGALKATHAPTRRGPRSPAGKRRRNQSRARHRHAALERRALEAGYTANNYSADPSGSLQH